MRSSHFWWFMALSALSPCCRAPSTITSLEQSVDAACGALHDAPARLWGERLPAVVQLGGAAEATLIQLIERRPAAPGAQASVAALGALGGADAVKKCRELVDERGALAVEAALSLGSLPTSADDPALRGCLQDRYTDATLRTAAACSLARHGEQQLAPRWVESVVRAGTPTGRADERELGVPQKTRWARERYFVQRLLLSLGHADLASALDTDAS